MRTITSVTNAASEALWTFAGLVNQQPAPWRAAIYVVAIVAAAVCVGALLAFFDVLVEHTLPPAMPPQWTLRRSGPVSAARERQIRAALSGAPATTPDAKDELAEVG